MQRALPLSLLLLVGAGCAAEGTLYLLSPAAGAVISGPTEVSLAYGADPDQLARVELYAAEGDEPVAVLGREELFSFMPWTVPWDPGALEGEVALEARALSFVGEDVVARATVDVFVVRAPDAEPPSPIANDDAGGEPSDDDATPEADEAPPPATAPEGWSPPPARALSMVDELAPNPTGDPSLPNPGNLAMFLHVPAELPYHAPVVVALHGCTQGALDYDRVAGWTKLADRYGFYVVLPEQKTGGAGDVGNPMRCFNWAGYYGEHMARGEGENQSIREMVALLVDDARYAADAARVFVTGLSAGAAMTNLLLATWPDVFAAGAPMAGVPALCADTVNEATACTSGGAPLMQSASTWAERVFAQGPAGYDGPWPRVMVWHGASDTVVKPANADETVEQWTAVHGADLVVDDDTPLVEGAAHEVKVYERAGAAVVVKVLVSGMGHAVAVDPGDGPAQGGQLGAFAHDAGIYSSYHAARFFGLVDEGGAADGGADDAAPPASDAPLDAPPDEGGAPCTEVTATIYAHQLAGRVENTGTMLAPVYVVVGSGEVLDAGLNPYFDQVTLRSSAEGAYALGGCA